MSELKKIAAQLAALLVFSAGLAYITNAARHDRLPLIMAFPPTYQCASLEKSGSALEVAQALLLFGKKGTAFVDARKREAFLKSHIKGALHIPYSFDEPLPMEALKPLKGYTTIIVYCNREGSEVSILLAGELEQADLHGVTYLAKGFFAWVKAGGPCTGTAPDGYDE